MGSSTLISTGLLFTAAAFSTQLMAAPAPIITSTINQPEFDSDSFGIGITASVAKRPFVGVDDQSTTLPYFSLNFGNLKVEFMLLPKRKNTCSRKIDFMLLLQAIG